MRQTFVMHFLCRQQSKHDSRMISLRQHFWLMMAQSAGTRFHNDVQSDQGMRLKRQPQNENQFFHCVNIWRTIHSASELLVSRLVSDRRLWSQLIKIVDLILGCSYRSVLVFSWKSCHGSELCLWTGFAWFVNNVEWKLTIGLHFPVWPIAVYTFWLFAIWILEFHRNFTLAWFNWLLKSYNSNLVGFRSSHESHWCL
jgi:hypothetical protein